MNERARYLRKNKTDAENKMWFYLRDRRLAGYKFVREKVIGNYIADFVCRERKLIIEVDGGQHMDAVRYDEYRSKILEGKGYKVLRVWNNEVFVNIEGVLTRILSMLEEIT